MRNMPNPHIAHSNRSHSRTPYTENRVTNSKTDNQHKKNYSFISYVKVAVKKVVGLFTIISVRKSEDALVAAIPDASKNSSRSKKSSSSTDLYSRSTWSSQRSQSSDFYGSSFASIGQLGSANFTIEEIYRATDNFSPANITGQGGFGTVYKGKLQNGSLVAIKRFKQSTHDKPSLLDFKNEVLALSKIEHLNLVRLYGYVEHKEERIIVVEYIGNGTLREHLDGVRGNGLDFAERLDVAIDVAHAIAYLHTYSEPPVIHRDIKASNILITEKLRAKVADFGFARMLTEDPGATHVSTQVKGTAGYLDPEYLKTYQLTEKSDVYSFGVLLVEMMTGRRPVEQKRTEKERITIRWALKKLRERDTVLAMDLRLQRSPASITAAEKVLRLAGKCLASVRDSRPTMKRCAEELWKIRKEYKEMLSSSSSSSSSAISSAKFHDADAKIRRLTFGLDNSEEDFKFNSA